MISKHLHIFFAFPSTYYANLNPLGALDNLESVTKEVKLMMDPNADPYAIDNTTSAPQSFGAKDITDLNWVQLLNAYSCTECGRCTSNCPANQTGKLLSPRKILMDTRDRIEEYSSNKRKGIEDKKSLLGDYISPEEIWACTSCNACTDSCPIELDPLSIIIDMRRYLVMEKSAAPSELNTMFTNIENNGAPWQFSAADRLNWKMNKLLEKKVDGEYISPVLPKDIKNYLIDIDGTICDDIPNEEPKRMATANLYPDALQTLNKWYDQGHYITFFTSRVEEHREVTEKWLKKNGFKYHGLLMGKPRR